MLPRPRVTRARDALAGPAPPRDHVVTSRWSGPDGGIGLYWNIDARERIWLCTSSIVVLAEQWLEAKLDLASKTRDRYEGIIRAHIQPRRATSDCSM